MEARAKFDRPPLGGPSHSSASNDAGVAQAVAAAARQAGVAATPTAPSSAQMANHEQYYNQQRANAAQAHSTAGAGAAASVAAAGAGDDAHNATTAEDSGHGGLSSSVRNMYRQLNNTNIFHAMSVIHEEKQVKDLSKFHDRKPMLYGSIALFSCVRVGSGTCWRWMLPVSLTPLRLPVRLTTLILPTPTPNTGTLPSA